jgi:hypothetical protein
MTDPKRVVFPWGNGPTGADMIVMIDPGASIPNGEIIKTEVDTGVATTRTFEFTGDDYAIGDVYPSLTDFLTANFAAPVAAPVDHIGAAFADAVRSEPPAGLREALDKLTVAADSATWKRSPDDNGGMGFMLVGQDGETIVARIKTFAFAKSAALRWSDHIDEPVSIMQLDEQGTVEDGVPYELWRTVEVASADVPDDVFDTECLSAELGRLDDAEASIISIGRAVSRSLDEVRRSRKSIRALSTVDGADVGALADIARGLADDFDTRAWNVLIAESDEDMIGELRAFE